MSVRVNYIGIPIVKPLLKGTREMSGRVGRHSTRDVVEEK